MRTREEQIADLANLFGEEGTFSFVDDLDAATKHILEAERRAEQRVRAEIARDSERLDWLEKSIPKYGVGRSYKKFYVDKGNFYVSSEETLRAAIDAARGVE